MRIFSEKYRLLGWLSTVLIVGFLGTSIAGYIVSRDAIRQGIEEQALPLTGDNIYSEIQKDLLRPVFISSLMAQDTFVRDWVLGGETDPTQIERYLREIKQRYNTITSFFISERTRRYYYADGILKTVQENEPRDKWYFRVRAMKEAYETNVDPDMANRDAMTIFINYRVLDYDGNFLGVAGVGLTFDTVTRILDSYQSRFHRSVYFIDKDGNVVLTGKSMKRMQGSIRGLPGIGQVAGRILTQSAVPTHLEYKSDHATVLVNSRFIPELGWYLVVEQDVSDDVKPVQQVFALNLGISAVITLLVLATTLLAVNHYQRRLEHVATTDALTGLLNRQAFEILFRQSLLDVDRHGKPLSAILFDIDLFKHINDTHGHLAGDQVLHTIGQLARRAVRENDIVARWGGEEFMILLRDCPLEVACKVAENLRSAIENHDFQLAKTPEPVTVSLGVAEYALQETQSGFFLRADKALYDAKAGGRNRIHVSPASQAHEGQ
ncbi:MAG TPA: sensor domain-containing diguanylate cyclase [Paucimonas sp.]|nr:sensor domain-containing diguanylate cyclase [Paucimonas sp.]